MPARKSFHDAVNEHLKEPEYRRMATEAVDILQQDPHLVGTFDDGEEFEVPFMDVYCQSAWPRKLKYEDLVLTAFAWQQVLSGHLIYSFIQTPNEPLRNSEVQGNQAILQQVVRDQGDRLGLIGAAFHGEPWGEDGYLLFAAPPIDRGGTCVRFPLELGDCKPDQMEFHLGQARCVARFPYRHQFIVLLEYVGPPRF